VEQAESAAEAGVRDEAAPGLANERRAEVGRGVVRRDAEEDCFDDFLRQSRRRRLHGDWQRGSYLLRHQRRSISTRFVCVYIYIYIYISIGVNQVSYMCLSSRWGQVQGD
jgi:hypothetical protein